MLIWLYTREVDFDKTVLYWTVELEYGEDANKWGYIIEISESNAETGPWYSLFKDPIHAYGFIDTVTQRGSINQRLYYRVRAVNDDGKRICLSPPIVIGEEQTNYLAQYIARQENLLLERYTGFDCLLYTRKRFGNRCPVCYSDIDRKQIRSKCPVCYGTTYEGGYFAPIKITIDIDPGNKSIDKTEFSIAENYMSTGWTTNDVILEPDDVIIDLLRPNERYLIGLIDPTKIRSTIKQRFQLIQQKTDHPIQLLKFDINAYTLNEFNVFRREWQSGK